MSLRREFVELARSGPRSIAMYCRRFGISRKTGYKWLERFCPDDPASLANRSTRPHHSPLRTPEAMEGMVLEVHRNHPWCGRKIRSYLLSKGVVSVPAASTITEILRRNNCISERATEQARHWRRFERNEPNELLQMDFKGHFAMRAGRCHPLTVLDDHSRFCLVLEACGNEQRQTVQAKLIPAFRRYGLPWQINVDNGPPWGAELLADHTRLTLWLIRLGITVTFSAPVHPQTNGKDERFHRTLKAEVLQNREFRNLAEAQQSFDAWREVYNFERPHDALDGKVPASRYRASQRPFPEVLPEICYAPGDTVRRVDTSGKLSYHGRSIRVGKALCGEPAAIRKTTEDGVIDVYYVRQKICTVDLRKIPKNR